MPDPAPRTLGRASRPLVVLVTALMLVLPVGASQAQQPEVHGKKFAAYEYQWYPIHFVDHFEVKDGGLSKKWKRQGSKNQVRTQNGMITIRTTRNRNVGATLRREAHRTGRWEIRLRGQRCARVPSQCQFDPDQANFTVAAELIPARGGYHCGARNIALTTFKPQDDEATYYARTQRGGTNHEFSRTKQLGLTTDKWHTYAVEVRRNRIAWFMDGKVIAAERRRAALSRIPMTFRLQLQAVRDRTMNEAQLQVDTVRYFTLESPRAKPARTKVGMRRGTYSRGC